MAIVNEASANHEAASAFKGLNIPQGGPREFLTCYSTYAALRAAPWRDEGASLFSLLGVDAPLRNTCYSLPLVLRLS